MFTVIIADKETIKLFEETKMFFGPLFDSEKVALCEWDKQGESFESALGGIYKLIEYRKEWRAVILNDDNIYERNPFDFTGYSDPKRVKKKDWDFYKQRRANRFAAYEKAVDNPLMKLTTALCANSGIKAVIADREKFERLVSGDMREYEYMLESRLNNLNYGELAGRFEKFQRSSLKRFVGEDQIDTLISYIKTADVAGVLSLIPGDDISDFIKFIDDDPEYFDPEYTDRLIDNTKKNELLNGVFKHFHMNDRLPSEVICLSPRTFDYASAEEEVKWENNEDRQYSDFAEHNLYSEKLKFIVFDILHKDHKQYKFDRIKLLCFILLLAGNDLPNGLVRAGWLYRAGIGFDTDIVRHICEDYVGKLKATEVHLREVEHELNRDFADHVDSKTAQRLFESDVNIPIKIDSEYKKTDLYCSFKDIGLATDCPEDESTFWSVQYRAINKNLGRYLREPRRAVKAAVGDGLRNNNLIKDDRTLLLTENQIEDVKCRLQEQEQTMVETVTTELFDTARFTERMKKADREVQRCIGQRMTKRKTVLAALVAMLAYLIGFIPMLFSDLNNFGTLIVSLQITAVVMVIFAICGFVYLFFLRKRLIKKLKGFNAVMGSICADVTHSLTRFSKYISCACNVMRQFSVLKNEESDVSKVKRILAYHSLKISEQIKTVNEMFSKYVDLGRIDYKSCEPYEFDFTVMREYDYEMPLVYSRKSIEYMQNGNMITVPVDYVESVTLAREELYD